MNPKYKNIETGGSAFPIVPFSAKGQEMDCGLGMTLRDYFAAKALAGITATVDWSGWSSKDVAENAYMVADAMIAERNK